MSTVIKDKIGKYNDLMRGQDKKKQGKKYTVWLRTEKNNPEALELFGV